RLTVQRLWPPRWTRRCGTSLGSSRLIMKNFFHDLYERIRESAVALRFGPSYRTKIVDELPDRMKTRILYLIGASQPWSAALICPCGCGELIQLSLLPHDSPSWRCHFESKRKPSLEPSIWRTTGCRS